MQVVYVLVDAMNGTVRPDFQHVIRVVIQVSDAEVAHAVELERPGFRLAFPCEDGKAVFQLMTVSSNKVGQFDESPVIFGLESVVSVMQSGLNIKIDAGTLAGQIVFI